MKGSWNLQVLNVWDSLESTSSNTVHFVACQVSETQKWAIFSLLESHNAQLHKKFLKTTKKRANTFAKYLQLIQGFQRQSKFWASSEVVRFKGPENNIDDALNEGNQMVNICSNNSPVCWKRRTIGHNLYYKFRRLGHVQGTQIIHNWKNIYTDTRNLQYLEFFHSLKGVKWKTCKLILIQMSREKQISSFEHKNSLDIPSLDSADRYKHLENCPKKKGGLLGLKYFFLITP